MSYVLLNSSAKITITSSASDDDHLVSLSAVTTAAYTVGEYKFKAFVSDGTDRYLIDDGSIEILADYAELATLDTRTHAEICLENIKAVLEGKATQDNYSFSIAGRSLSKYSWEELITAKNHYAAEVRGEKNKESGKSQSNLIKMRFV